MPNRLPMIAQVAHCFIVAPHDPPESGPVAVFHLSTAYHGHELCDTVEHQEFRLFRHEISANLSASHFLPSRRFAAKNWDRTDAHRSVSTPLTICAR